MEIFYINLPIPLLSTVSSCYSPLQEIGKGDILTLVRQAVSQCRWFLQPGGSTVMKAVTDMLIKSAILPAREPDVVNGHMFTVTVSGVL